MRLLRRPQDRLLGQPVGQWPRPSRRGRTRTTGTGRSSCSRVRTHGLRRMVCPDGRVAYPEIGVLYGRDESLQEALGRKKRQLVAELFARVVIASALDEGDSGTHPAYSAKRSGCGADRSAADEVQRGNVLLVGATDRGKVGLAVDSRGGDVQGRW